MKIRLLVVFLFVTGGQLLASHLRCGFITAEPVNCNSRIYRITVTVYTNTGSPVVFGDDGILSFGDGNSVVIPEVQNTPRPDLGANVGMASYTLSHTFGSTGSYLISYVEPNRNGGVLNMDNSFFTTFYTETRISINPEYGCSSSPRILAEPVFKWIAGDPFSVSLASYSPNDRRITYSMATPYRDKATPVLNYRKPENISINHTTGQLTWDGQFMNLPLSGEYSFAVRITEHVMVDDVNVSTGYVRVDFQVILEEPDVSTPTLYDDQELDALNRILIKGGEESEIILNYQSNSSWSSLLVFSELTEHNGAIKFVKSEASDFITGKLTIAIDPSLVRSTPYSVVVRGRSQTGLITDTNYLIYTDELPPLPEIVTGTEEKFAPIEIFPNPTYDYIHVKSINAGQYQVTLYNLQGNRIKQKFIVGDETISLQDIPNGVYVCEIAQNNRIHYRTKIIKR